MVCSTDSVSQGTTALFGGKPAYRIRPSPWHKHQTRGHPVSDDLLCINGGSHSEGPDQVSTGPVILFADDTLFFIPGTPGQVRATLESLLQLLRQYGEVLGYRLNMDKCGVVFQGPDAPPPKTVLYGVQERSKVKYLGTWLGHAIVLDQYQGPLAKLVVKAQFLASLPLIAEEKIQALYAWAYLVLRHIAILFFPTQQVIRKANMAMRVAPGIRSWVLPTTQWKLPHNRGGYALGSAGDFLLRCHLAAYVRALKALEGGEETMDMCEFRDWVRRKAPKLWLDPVHVRSFSWFRQPQDQWPVVVTSLVAYSAFTHICPRTCLDGQDLLQIPLWNSVFFHQPVKSRVQENCFRTFYRPALVARGVQRVADCVAGTGQLNAAILLRILQSYRTLYARLLLQYIDAAHQREPRPQWSALPPLQEWKVSGFLKVCRQHLRVDRHQPELVWEALLAQAVPFKLREFVVMVCPATGTI